MSSLESKRSGRPADPEKRDSIVMAAAHSFFDRGFAATSIEQVAADAGVSKVTIYNNFGDKRALFAAAVEHECEKMRSYFEVPDMPSGTVRDRMMVLGEAILAFLSRDEMVQFERRIAAETEQDPAIGAAFLAAGPHRMKSGFTQFLKAMCDAGELVIDDHELAAEQFVSMCKGMGDLERRFGEPIDPKRNQQRITGAVDVFLQAYAAKRDK